MSFVLRNLTLGAVAIDDLGITIPASTDVDIADLQPNDVSISVDLVDAIVALDIAVLDPLDGVTQLNAADSQEVIISHNDPHWGIRRGELDQLDDVDLSGESPGDVLQLSGGTYSPVSPATLAGDMVLGDLGDVDDLAAHTASSIVVFKGDGTNLDTVTAASDSDFQEVIEDYVGGLIANGTDTTVVYDDGAGTLVINVDDVFLRNTGDTLDSGTLTIASGATINIASGGDLTIQDAPVNATDATNKEYVDSVAAGLDPKESVRYCTVDSVGGTYASGGGAGGTGEFTGVDLTDSAIFDGLTAGAIIVDDRILVKAEVDTAGFADAAVSGSPAGSVVPGIAAATYDFDVNIDGGGNSPESITTAGGEDYDAIAALMSAQVTGGSVAFVSGAF